MGGVGKTEGIVSVYNSLKPGSAITRNHNWRFHLQIKKVGDSRFYLWTEKVKRNKARVNVGKLKAGEDQSEGGFILAIDNTREWLMGSFEKRVGKFG